MTEPAPDRIRLRRLKPSDLRAFQAYRRDPEVARFQGWTAMTDDRAAEFIGWCASVKGFPAGWWQLGIARVADDRLVGDLGLCLSEDGTEVELGITLAREAWGAGHGIAAVEQAAALVWMATDATRIVAITDARNARALALIERLGLRFLRDLRSDGIDERMFELRRPEARNAADPVRSGRDGA